jgi:hypothetical protein
MQGVGGAGEFQAGVMYTVPHRFWAVTGAELQKTPRVGSIHLMAVIWDSKTGTILPEAGLSVEIRQDTELISEEVIYPMLSQQMGFHYGGNFSLPTDGAYTALVSIGGLSIRRTGAFQDRLDESATIEIPFTFDEIERDAVTSTELSAYGKRGAVKPIEMEMLPQATALAESALPGIHATPKSDDAVLATGTMRPPEGVNGTGDYLYVSARTPYNRLILPAMGLYAVVSRAGEQIFKGSLRRTLDSELGYHYGVTLGARVTAGDTVRLEPRTPPQLSRHEGYERAFVQMKPVEFTI